MTAGYREMGEEGAALEAEMVARANAAGITLVGPNCEGICCPARDFYPWMSTHRPAPGPISVIAQSGNILNMIIGHAQNCGFGVAKGISSGNEAQLTTGDYISYLAGDPETEVIISYIEGLEDGRGLFEKARAATARKPVVMLKGGRSALGMRAALSHTGALAVENEVFESACRQAGIVLADTIREAGILASSFIGRPLPRGRRVGIVTGGGGLGVIAADACSRFGLDLPMPSSETIKKISEYLPAYFVPGNPIDLVAGLNIGVIAPIIEILMRSGEVDAVAFIYIESTRSRSSDGGRRGGGDAGRGIEVSRFWVEAMRLIARDLSRLNGVALDIGVPLYVTAAMGSELLEEVVEETGRVFPTVYDEVEACCGAISAMAQYNGVRYLDVNGPEPMGSDTVHESAARAGDSHTVSDPDMNSHQGA